MMRLLVLLPTEILIDESVSKVIAEAENGSFCLLPKHIDFVAALVPGILTYSDASEQNHYIGVSEGLLVKSGRSVRVSVASGVSGAALGQLRQAVKQHFEAVDDRERQAVSAMARLEADFARRFIQLRERPDVG